MLIADIIKILYGVADMEQAFTISALLPLLLFTLTASITPGPNNLMMLSSGLNFGMRRTIPCMMGMICGFFLLIMACGIGAGAVLQSMPVLYNIMKITGCGYLLYLAWKISRISATNLHIPAGTPIRFTEALLLQFVNPKAWMMGTSAATLFMPVTNPPIYGALYIASVFVCVGAPCVWLWAAGGETIRNLLHNPGLLRWISSVIAALTAATAVIMLFSS